MPRFNDFIQLDDVYRQDVDDILTFDSETADVYRIGTVEGAGFTSEVSDQTRINRISLKLGFLGSKGERFEYIGLVVDEDVLTDDLLVIRGDKYRVERIERNHNRAELYLIKQL